MRYAIRFAALTAAIAGLFPSVQAQVLYNENFDDGAAAGRFTTTSSADDLVVDSVAQFNLDYSTLGIPAAPRGGNAIGMKLDANVDANGVAASVNAYPAAPSYSGDYVLRYDVFARVVGGGGTTEHILGGINASGTNTNWYDFLGVGNTDGQFFGVAADGGAGFESYIRFQGNTPGVTVFGLYTPDDTLPQAAYRASNGAPEGTWSTIEVAQIDGVIRWRINGVEIDSFANPGTFTSGNVFVGYEDEYSSINPDTFGVFDNVEVIRPHRWNLAGSGSWNSAANWATGIVPNGTDVIASLDSNATSTAIVSIASPVTLGTLIFKDSDGYILGGGATITLATTGQAANIDSYGGVHTISNPVRLTRNVVMNVDTAQGSPSSVDLTGALTFDAGVSLSKVGRGVATFSTPIRMTGGGKLGVHEGTVSLSGTASPFSPAGVSVVNQLEFLTIGTSVPGTLNLQNNSMVIDYSGASPQDAVKGLIQRGSNLGLWNGTGIMSSLAAAAAATPDRTAIGYAEASQLNLAAWLGQPTDGTSLILAYVYEGDTNLNRRVDTLDFNNLAGNFGASGTGTWLQGDFNYDGNIDSADFTALAANYGKTLPAASTGLAPGLGSVVPEPTMLGFLLIGLTFSRRRPR